MIKLLSFLIVSIFLTGNLHAQILQFEFSTLAGSEVTASSSANEANLQASTISRGAGLTASGNGGRFNATNWSTVSIDDAVTNDKYMEFTITPQAGFQFSVSSIFINLQRSATGPSSVALRSSVDSYASNLDQVYPIVDNTSTQSFTFTFSQSNSTVPVTYRFYMNAEATTGSGGIGDGTGDDIVVSGTTSSTAPNDAPEASSVSFSGTLEVGQLLTGSYTYSDNEDDTEGTSTFRWLRSDDIDGLNEAAIGSATSSTYTLQVADLGKFISFEVTPVASAGTSPGTAVASTRQGAVAAASNDAPVASNVTFTGTLTESQTLTGDYDYSDTESNPEGTSMFRWLRSDDASGTNEAAIGGATSSTYVLQAADISKYISFEVTPIASAGTLTGTAIASSRQGAVAAIPNDAPVASNVTFTGTLSEGQTLTGDYDYTDTEGNLEGTSTFRWLRSDDGSGTNEAAISGATSLTYVLQASDVTKFISFEVTPVAQTGALTGTAVASSRQGTVTGLPALIFDEPFDYVADGTNGLSAQSGNVWMKVNTGDSILVTAGSLALNGFQASEGNKVSFGSTGTDYNRTFASRTSGTVYFSFLLNVTSLGSLNTGGGYFSGIASSTSNFGATIWLKSSGSDYNIGIAPRTGTATYATGTYTTGSTVLVVGSYELVSGAGNDIVKLWVNPAQGTYEAVSEPTPDVTITNTAGSDLTLIDRFFLRQDSATETPETDVDELKVGSTWAVVTPSGPVNNAPVASNVTFTGTLQVGQTLTGDYDYSDTETDAEGTSTFRWLRSDDGAGLNETAIGGATAPTYTLQVADLGKFISFEVTPVASAGTSPGTAVASTRQGAVAAASNDAPVASNVTFTGTLTEGQTLTGDYDYSDTESNPEGTSMFRWLRSDDASGTNEAAIGGATSSTYTLQAADLGKFISFEVTPVASTGTLTGTAVASARQGTVAASPVTNITLSGSVAESNEDAGSVTVTLANDTFVGSLTPANWTITNLPAGVSVESITRDSDTQVTIALSGNRTTDYDSDITNLTVSVTSDEFVTLGSGSVDANSGFTFTATDDNESISIADDGTIIEGSEDGEILTVTLTGGTFISTINEGNFTVTNLPAGVSKGTVTRTSATTVTIALSGNASGDYDTDITNVTVSVADTEVDDYTGSDLSDADGVTLTATVEPVFVVFEFALLAGNEATAPSTGNDGNLQASTISRGAGLTAATNGGRFNATNWSTVSIDDAVSNDKYMEFTITPQSGFQFSVSSIFINLQRSSTGPSSVALRSSVDNYASNLDQVYPIVDNTSTQSFTFTFAQSNSTVPVTYRFYMNAEQTGGSGGIGDGTGDDIVVTGTTSAAPPENPTSGNVTSANFTNPTTLTGDLNVTGTLTIGAQVNTGGNTINLGASGSLSGETPATYIIGTIQVLPTVNGAPLVNVGGLGVNIDPGAANMGVTTVIRETGPAIIFGGSVAQRWTITPNTQPGEAVTVTLSWPDENNAGVNVDGSPLLFKSEDGGNSWSVIPVISWNTAGNPNTVTFEVTSFSEFTIGDEDSPLPIELVSWQAVAGNGKVTLKWETGSELNNAGFELFRSTGNKDNFLKIGSFLENESLRSKGDQGGKYEFTDIRKIYNGLTYFYKLVDVAVDGARVEHAIIEAIPTDGKNPGKPFELPAELEITSIYPNPFNPTAVMTYNLPEDGLVTIRVFNVLGQEMAVLKSGFMKAGRDFTQTINADNLPTGTYFAVLEFKGLKQTSRFTVLK